MNKAHSKAFRIKVYRLSLGLTQEEFAKRIGVSLRSVSEAESDQAFFVPQVVADAMVKEQDLDSAARIGALHYFLTGDPGMMAKMMLTTLVRAAKDGEWEYV